eukprot:CAMPEP_0184862416 /NCGR_PEP_ID=MMETSP0580-20130426/6879_1 /TAXON_ID=1118495 /ORGANISM="Dactyliosolen fragilissimus" /LENGTH=641 /DNA_ID=CAMNT_0027360271 /DNA_START=118 /DNA_END=2043 /DNA_ORIENTATION=-
MAYTTSQRSSIIYSPSKTTSIVKGNLNLLFSSPSIVGDTFFRRSNCHMMRKDDKEEADNTESTNVPKNFEKDSESVDKEEQNSLVSDDTSSNLIRQEGTKEQKQSVNKQVQHLEAERNVLLKRVTQLEDIVSRQAVDMRHMKCKMSKMEESLAVIAGVLQVLRQAGLSDNLGNNGNKGTNDQLLEVDDSTTMKDDNTKRPKNEIGDSQGQDNDGRTKSQKEKWIFQSFEDAEIFGGVPSSISDAADAAGASILAAMLAGKQRMLVDVRDAELSRDSTALVQFIELAILPVAAGLEGLRSKRNRVKIVFPTVSQLLKYRKTMTLAAPEVVALSTLGFDPVEDKDNLVVMIAPPPDDAEGLEQMNNLLKMPSAIQQPLVVLNHHMIPILGPAMEYEAIYHLRLLSVHYMTGEPPSEEWSSGFGPNKSYKTPLGYQDDIQNEANANVPNVTLSGSDNYMMGKENSEIAAVSDKYAENLIGDSNVFNGTQTIEESVALSTNEEEEDKALEAAMEHAHELGTHQGITRAMVIRAYPRPWHVFVDTSPDTDADYEVAATFDEAPSIDDVNNSIVECLEGSEREDELVAQQMQEALDAGQLSKVSEMLGLGKEHKLDTNKKSEEGNLDKDGDDEDIDIDWDSWDTDTV